MYVKVNNGSVVEYPFTTAQLQRENRNVSFPKNFHSDFISQYGVYSVTELEEPTYNPETENCVKDSTPTLIDGEWVLGWTVSNKTAEELAEIEQLADTETRSMRNSLLASSDWTQLADAPVDATAWAAYRQELRDLTTHANWPNLSKDDWPTSP